MIISPTTARQRTCQTTFPDSTYYATVVSCSLVADRVFQLTGSENDYVILPLRHASDDDGA